LPDQKFDEYTKKIKRLASSEEVNLAIDFVRSINSPRLYEELLKDCSIDEYGEVVLQGWWEEEEEEDGELLQFFFELVAHCPEEASINSSLKRESITSLTLSYRESLTNVDVLSNYGISRERGACLPVPESPLTALHHSEKHPSSSALFA
jgi:hypothetical protein